MVNGNLNSIKYQTEILGDIKLKCDCLAYPIKNYIFMHDKAPCHFSASTQRFMADRGVDVLPWPGNSPDLNPIEKVWDIMKKQTNKTPNNKAKFWENITSLWYSINRKEIMALYDSMPKRVEAVYKAKGGPTQY